MEDYLNMIFCPIIAFLAGLIVMLGVLQVKVNQIDFALISFFFAPVLGFLSYLAYRWRYDN
jgi:hypothetical protein